MIHHYEYCIKKNREIGIVTEVRDFLVKVQGLPGAVIGEGIAFRTGENGRVIKLQPNEVEVLVFSRSPVKSGIQAGRSGKSLSISCSEKVLGQVVNVFGHLFSGHKKKVISLSESREIEKNPIGIAGRKKISRSLSTGVAIVDLLVPLSHGQRELVIGDRKTGKTQFILKTIIQQIKLGTICVYCMIGKRSQEVKAIEEFFKQNGLLEKSVLVVSTSSSSPGEIVYAPYTAMTLAEYFRDQGKDVLLIFDDLTVHAKYYREIALLSGTFPGREAYPGDIFHFHSNLLERAGCFNLFEKEVAITCLPIAESLASDLAGYIQTNLMSMTDGHLFFDSENFAQGRRPAVNIFLSVTRVGRQALTPLFRDINSKLTIFMKKYENTQKFLRFGSELPEEIKNTLILGEAFWKFFRQTDFKPLPPELQAVFISAICLGLWDGQNATNIVEKISPEEHSFLKNLVNQNSFLYNLNKSVSKEQKFIINLIER